MRKVSVSRSTQETEIMLSLNLDGSGRSKIKTGIGFFDHMLDLLAFHGKLDIELEAKGDLHVDSHHLVEDVGLLMGQAIREALGSKKGVERYGMSLLPMDESLARVVLDMSGRSYLIYDCEYNRLDLGDLDVQNIEEFFKSVCNESKMTCHMTMLYGSNDHHKAEALFKAFGRALRQAVKITSGEIPSSKGVL